MGNRESDVLPSIPILRGGNDELRIQQAFQELRTGERLNQLEPPWRFLLLSSEISQLLCLTVKAY